MIIKKDYSHLAEKIREIRKANGLTMEEMGWRLGVIEKVVDRWENGKARPNSKRCRIIADMGGISLDELYGENHNHKDDAIQDLNKAINFLKRAIKRLETGK